MERNASYPLDQISLIQVKLAWAHLDITAASVPEIQALIAGDDDTVQELVVRQEEQKLIIEQPQYGLYLKMGSGKWLQICLRVPREWCGDIDASTISGALCVRNITGNDTVLDTVSGALHAQHVKAMALTMRSVSGAVIASTPQADKVYLRSLSGDVTVLDATVTSIKTTTVSGDVSLAFEKPFETLELQTVSGSQRVIVPSDVVNVSLTSVRGKLTLENIETGENGPRIAATTVTGGLTVSR